MKVKITAVSSPKFSAADKSQIDCIVDGEHIGTDLKYTAVPFTSRADDPEPHGRQLFAELMAGKHGEIEPHSDNS